MVFKGFYRVNTRTNPNGDSKNPVRLRSYMFGDLVKTVEGAIANELVAVGAPAETAPARDDEPA